MQITILMVDLTTKPTAKGSYGILEVTFKDEQGKPGNRKVMSFGTGAKAFNALKGAVKGQVYEIDRVDELNEKDGKTYKNWSNATLVEGGASTPFPTLNTGDTPASKPSFTPGGKTTSTYETPEERAKKQIYIVRQSSITAAIGLGAKTIDDAIRMASQLEEFVFNGLPAELDVPVVAVKKSPVKKAPATVVESFGELEDTDEFGID